jgi:replicative DNA helicase
MGKTSLAVQIALHNEKQGKGVIIDELEMPSEQIILRMIAHKNQEDISDLKKGQVKNIQKFNETLQYLSQSKNLIIHDRPLSFKQLKSKMLRLKRDRDKRGLDTSMWIIDHVGYVNTDVRFKREDLTAGTKMLKQLAKDLDIAIIALSQLNRSVKDRKGMGKFRPMLSDLKESGSLEEDCDMAIFPHRDSYYAKAEKNEIEPPINPANILILKNRNGPSGVVNCDFNGPTNSFGYYPVMEMVEFRSDSNDDIPEI